MKKIMVFGTFDIFHPGHRNFLRQARKYGDYLIVVVARDETVARYKKPALPAGRQETRNKERIRLKEIKNGKLADQVILGGLGDKYEVIKKHKPDIICLGYDQKFFVRGLKKKLADFKLKTKIIRLKPYKPEVYKSSKLSSLKNTN